MTPGLSRQCIAFALPLERAGIEVAESRLGSRSVVEHLQVLDQVGPSRSPRNPGSIVDQLDLSRREEPFGHRVAQQFPSRLMLPTIPC